MTIELILLIGILLAKAQQMLTPAGAAKDNAAAATKAQQDANAAAARGDHETAAAKQAEAQQHAAAAKTASKAAKTPPPWPQVLPRELPPFPGPGWHPASPVTSAMAARAWQLLQQLWAAGEGTWKAEKTADRWVVYQAAQTSPGKKGVVAYTTNVSTLPTPAAAPDGAMAMAPTAPPPAAAPVQVTPASTLAPVDPVSKATLHDLGVPTLRLTSPRMSGPTVVWLQQQLGVPPDGVYGPGTMAAVQHYQSAHGLSPDGVVGPQTWAAFGLGVKRTAA